MLLTAVLEYQVPADDPGDEFSHRRVSIGVRAACNRNHGGKLGVAHDANPQAIATRTKERAMAGPAPGRPNEAECESGIPEEERSGWKRLETLPGDCRADDGKDAGADDCADSQGRQAQPSKGFFLAGLQHFPNPRSFQASGLPGCDRSAWVGSISSVQGYRPTDLGFENAEVG